MAIWEAKNNNNKNNKNNNKNKNKGVARVNTWYTVLRVCMCSLLRLENIQTSVNYSKTCIRLMAYVLFATYIRGQCSMCKV